ncbi:MAG: hypothetical protein AAB368_07875, partial [bacterium]
MSLSLMSVALLAMLRSVVRGRGIAAPAFLSGLALSHHLHGLYLVPAGLALLRRRRVTGRTVAMAAALALLPLAAKPAATALRAAADPPLNWGLPDRPGRLVAYLAARQYRFIMLAHKGPADVPLRALRQGTVLPLGELGPGVALAAPGLAALARAAPGLLPGAGLVFAANLWFASAYDTPEIERYYLLSYALLAFLMGLGWAALARRSRIWGTVALLAVAAPLALNARVSPRGRHYLAYDFAVNQLGSLPRRAMLICEGDDQAFPLFYVHDVLGVRPDVALLPMPFACWEPAYARLPRHMAGLSWPPFSADPGVHLPRLIAANVPARPAFYTPGCSGQGSEGHLVPLGPVFAAYVDPAETLRARRAASRFPALRLRGAVDAADYRDPVTSRAVVNYGLALAYHGADLLERGQPAAAERYLAEAARLPLQPLPLAAALTHRGLCRALLSDPDGAERLLRRAIERAPEFGPGLFQLARLLLVRRRGIAEARGVGIRFIYTAAHP